MPASLAASSRRLNMTLRWSGQTWGECYPWLQRCGPRAKKGPSNQRRRRLWARRADGGWKRVITFPTEEQLAYMKTSLEENVYLKARPGSGKTEVNATMVSQAIRCWARFPAG